jgi:hypothetical protein
LFFKLLFNVNLDSIQVIGPWLWGNRSFFSLVVGQRKGPSGANAPPVHGIKKCLERPQETLRYKLKSGSSEDELASHAFPTLSCVLFKLKQNGSSSTYTIQARGWLIITMRDNKTIEIVFLQNE